MDVGMERAVPALREALDFTTDKTWLLMEDSAGAGGTIGRSIDELAALFDACDGHERLGVCLDTCHLYVSGIDVTDRDALDDVLAELDQRIGLDRLRALHINDATDPLGSNRDRHANIGEGVLGDKLGVFLSHTKLQGLPAFLEVPGPDKHGPDASELKKVRSLHKRWVATAG
jgi:deoxyribonuclease-4